MWDTLIPFLFMYKSRRETVVYNLDGFNCTLHHLLLSCRAPPITGGAGENYCTQQTRTCRRLPALRCWDWLAFSLLRKQSCWWAFFMVLEVPGNVDTETFPRTLETCLTILPLINKEKLVFTTSSFIFPTLIKNCILPRSTPLNPCWSDDMSFWDNCIVWMVGWAL